MTAIHFLAGDWGTTKLNLTLFQDSDGGARAVKDVQGPGIKSIRDFETTFVELVGRLWAGDEPITAYLSGMIGSSIGWKEAPYASCPVDADVLNTLAIDFRVHDRLRVVITPGARCINTFGYPDVMRGEEIQIFGALKETGASAEPHILCLPGTHAKWVLVKDDKILRFETSLQGELFDVIDKHTILTAHAPQELKEEEAPGPGFEKAIQLLRAQPLLTISQALFATRSLTLSGDLAAEHTRDFLSGLSIGADIRDIATRLLKEHSVYAPIAVIGAPALTRRYKFAFDLFDLRANEIDGAKAANDGLCQFRAQRIDVDDD